MRSFLRFIFALSFVSLLILTTSPCALAGGKKAGAEKDFIGRLEKRYQAIKTLKADFTQTSKGLASMDGASGGKVYFKKPGMIRWTYRGKITDEIVGSDKVLWFYQPDLNQAFKSEGKRPDISTDFLSGMGSIRKYFIPSAAPVKAGSLTIKLEPRDTHPQIKTLSLFVDTKTMLVKKFILKDHYGNTTEVNFSNIKINAPIGDELFKFSPPEGTSVIVQ